MSEDKKIQNAVQKIQNAVQQNGGEISVYDMGFEDGTFISWVGVEDTYIKVDFFNMLGVDGEIIGRQMQENMTIQTKPIQKIFIKYEDLSYTFLYVVCLTIDKIQKEKEQLIEKIVAIVGEEKCDEFYLTQLRLMKNENLKYFLETILEKN
jgi:hypothetical protein